MCAAMSAAGTTACEVPDVSFRHLLCQCAFALLPLARSFARGYVQQACVCNTVTDKIRCPAGAY